MIDNRTTNFNLPLPNPSNYLGDDVLRLVSALNTIDAQIAARVTTASIGTTVQGHDADLDALASLVSAADTLPYFTGPQAAALTSLTALARTLLGNSTTAQMRTTLGLGSYPLSWQIIAANTTAVSPNQYFCNTSGGSFTLTLPASPSVNDRIAFADYSGTFASFPLTVARNGSNIMGLAEDMTCDVSHISIALIYVDATQGWRIV